MKSDFFSNLLGVPSIVGFLLAGMALGPHGLELIEGEATLGAIGELGVILLLFMLGLEFSLGKLMELRRLIFGVGLLQVATTSAYCLLATFLPDLSRQRWYDDHLPTPYRRDPHRRSAQGGSPPDRPLCAPECRPYSRTSL